ncbi:hypothetical protein N0V93_005085 [Gnomoniopsis smithogilvyi]|uniref:Rhodopsin domain-containing protein n=1 Tax=Gnomoniopsis smithogilvyi TaxID=1191159 RepID=A0A9W8YTP5_9PEZI|nr:hypothetical protein N0V93_005085 [Gnomoniopsis smithogilvyi]
MQIPPLSVLSSFPAPNFVNPETAGPAAFITVSILLFLVTVLLGIRIYTRLWISRGFGLDDIFIMLAYIPTLAFAIISYVAQVDFHWGRHIWDVPLEDVTPSLQASLASQLMFDLSTTLTKLSMLALIWRVVSLNQGRYKYAVIVVALIVAIDGIVFFFITTFQCSPPEAYWTLSITPQDCINEQKHLLAAGCINTTTDFLIVLLPIPFILRLNLPRRQQIIVGSLFAGGLFATAAGAVRTAITFSFTAVENVDKTRNAVPIIIASSLELFVGIICASITPTKPFFARYLPQLIGNPISWLSRNGQSRGAYGQTMDQKPGPDFWLVTKDRQSTIIDPDIESQSLVMAMQPMPLMPGMPTPTKPPRTQSTMKSLIIQEPNRDLSFNKDSKNLRPDSFSSNTTASTAILNPASAVAKTLNLNKPLPIPRPSLDMDEEDMPEQEKERNGPRKTSPTNMLSVYKLVPYEDGHISVHKTKEVDNMF